MAAAVLLVGLTPFQLIWSTALFTTYSMCMAARMAQMQAYALQRVDAAQRGRYSALISFWMQLGATAGVAATASGLSHFDLSLDRGGMTAIAIICCVLLLGTAVLCMRLPYQGEVADAGR
jgi:ABC-type glycerol-3-phosphate transport system permease component